MVKAPYRDRAGRVIGLIGTVRDETAAQQLEEQASRYFDLAPDMLCTLGPDGRFERVNDAWTQALGWTAEEVRGRPLGDFVHPDDRADRSALRLATRSGGWRDVEWTSRYADGRVYAVARDVTERNRIEGALAASEERYRELVHNLPNAAVLTFDHDLRYTFAAGEMLAAAGLDSGVVGRTLGESLPDLAGALTPRYRAALGGHPQAFEFSAIDREFWIQIAPLHDAHGAIDGGMVLAQDITALKDAQRELNQAEERFRTAFERAPIGMGLLSPDGRHLRVNEALCRITGYEAEQLLATTVEAITHPDDVAADTAGRADLLAGRTEIHRMEKRYLHAAGHQVWVSVHATLVRDADGEPSHILGQIQDITDRRRFEERLQHLVDHDPLTGLFNRRRFEQELDRHVAQVARYGAEGALLILDLDNFKLINDTLGHHAGDELIVSVAGLLGHAAARLGHHRPPRRRRVRRPAPDGRAGRGRDRRRQAHGGHPRARHRGRRRAGPARHDQRRRRAVHGRHHDGRGDAHQRRRRDVRGQGGGPQPARRLRRRPPRPVAAPGPHRLARPHPRRARGRPPRAPRPADPRPAHRRDRPARAARAHARRPTAT